MEADQISYRKMQVCIFTLGNGGVISDRNNLLLVDNFLTLVDGKALSDRNNLLLVDNFSTLVDGKALSANKERI